MFEYNQDGTFKNCSATIEQMREYFNGIETDEDRGFLEDHQMEFVNNLLHYYKIRGKLSDKQFKWLCYYYREVEGEEDHFDDWPLYSGIDYNYRFA